MCIRDSVYRDAPQPAPRHEQQPRVAPQETQQSPRHEQLPVAQRRPEMSPTAPSAAHPAPRLSVTPISPESSLPLSMPSTPRQIPPPQHQQTTQRIPSGHSSVQSPTNQNFDPFTTYSLRRNISHSSPQLSSPRTPYT